MMYDAVREKGDQRVNERMSHVHNTTLSQCVCVCMESGEERDEAQTGF